MQDKKFLGTAVLSIAFLALLSPFSLASEEGFSHPRIGENPHERLERSDPHDRFKEEHRVPHEDRFRRGGHHGFSAEGLKAFLKLDDDQAKKMREVLRNYRKGVILKEAELRVAQLELDGAVAEGDFVMSEIEKRVMAREAAASALTLVRIQSLAEAKSFLSHDQFRQFMGRVTYRMRKGQHNKRHPGRRPYEEERRHHKKSRHGEGEYEDYRQ